MFKRCAFFFLLQCMTSILDSLQRLHQLLLISVHPSLKTRDNYYSYRIANFSSAFYILLRIHINYLHSFSFICDMFAEVGGVRRSYEVIQMKYNMRGFTRPTKSAEIHPELRKSNKFESILRFEKCQLMIRVVNRNYFLYPHNKISG